MRGRDDGKKPVRFNSMTDGVSFVPCFLAENFSHYLLSCMRLKMRKTFVIEDEKEVFHFQFFAKAVMPMSNLDVGTGARNVE
jgi:hypothetical protein